MRLLSVFTTLAFMLITQVALAQGQFATAVTVNDRVITTYELDQRARMLALFRTPGDLPSLAREQLIDDRLKQDILARSTVSLSPTDLQTELDAFAGRANLTYDQFVTVLAQNGVDASTLSEFVSVGVKWRTYIRARYSRDARISDAEVARALGKTNGSVDGVEVLLNEIIIAAPPPRAAAAMATAQRISQLRSTSAFEAQARRVSALPSRTNGGRLGWLRLSNYPPQLHGLLLGLSPGEVTAPLPITNGVALFQLRAIREVPQPRPAPTEIEFAAYYIGGGAANLAAAQQLADTVDTCDDLFGTALGQPEEVLQRDSLAPADIPDDVALELAKLDQGEVSYNLTRSNGETRVFLMLCDRVTTDGASPDREAVRNQLRSQRLSGLADALIADLRAAATING